MKIRVKFKKWGCMKFIGHLDMMRYFQKAVRRADIDIRYSEGYSAHQIMSFAAPLGVGITSDGEYFDIDVNTTESTEKSIQALNAQMVDGVEVTGYVLLPDDAKKAMSLVAAADYVLSFKDGYESPYTIEEGKEAIDKHFFDEPSFVVMKKTKKSEREVDIKPLVYKLTVMENNKKPEFFMQVSTGSIDNIKPEFVRPYTKSVALITIRLPYKSTGRKCMQEKTMEHSFVCLTWEKKSHNEQNYSD